VKVVPVKPSGGQNWADKLSIAANIPAYGRVILRELRSADVVHIRAPANISLLAMVLLAFVRHPKRRWIKYAGNWKPFGPEAKSYTFQRWWLRRGWHRGLVTVNGEWPDMPAHVHTFFNPCLTDEELETGRCAASGKALENPIRLLFVGRLDTAKGADRVLRIAAELKKHGVIFSLDMIGDSPERELMEKLAQQLGIEERVRFHGWIPKQALPEYYSQAHFLMLPSRTEGWAKVLSEAMAFGVVPIASKVGSIPQYLTQFRTGRALASDDVEAFVNELCQYVQHSDVWKNESTNGIEAAKLFCYSLFLQAVSQLLQLTLSI